MKKIMKNKKGFTLVEMVIVIAIIIILAAVILFTVTRFIDAADSAADELEANSASVESVMDRVGF